MCCIVEVLSPTPDMAAVEAMLEMSAFKRDEKGDWVYTFPDDVRKPMSPKTLTVKTVASIVSLKLEPGIGGHSFYEHEYAALQGSMMFKLANIIAESTHGRILHRGRLGACKSEARSIPMLIADYTEAPVLPLLHEHLCPGFRQALEKGVHLGIA